MVSIVGGSGILEQASEIANQAAQNAIRLAELSGLINPVQVGLEGVSGFLPTLERELGFATLAEQARGTDLSHQLGLGNLALAVQAENARQRQAEAQLRQNQLGMLASLRGPANAIGYNYLLNAAGKPTGTQVDPFASLRTIAQPFDLGSLLAQVGAAPRPSLTFTVSPPVAPPALSPRVQAAPAFTGAVTHLPTSGREVEVTPQHYQQAVHAIQSYGSPEAQRAALTSPTTGAVMTPEDLAAYTAVAASNPSEAANWLREHGYLGAEKGARVRHRSRRQRTATVVVGERAPEIVVGRDFEVIPLERGRHLLSGAHMAQSGARVRDGLVQGYDELVGALARTPGALAAEAAPAPPSDPLAPGAPTPFSFEVFSPEQIAATPAVQQLLGVARTRPFGATSLDLRIPGTRIQLPLTVNVARLSQLQPSAQELIQGLYETPRELGGLGLDWRDVLAASRASAPLGTGFSLLSGYGG